MERDKEMHFWAGVSIGIFALVIFKAVEVANCHLWIAAAVLVAAVGKEFKDYIDYGRPDWKDAAYTIAGGVPAFVLSFF